MKEKCSSGAFRETESTLSTPLPSTNSIFKYVGYLVALVLVGAPLGYVIKDVTTSEPIAVVSDADVDSVPTESVTVGQLLVLQATGNKVVWTTEPIIQDCVSYGAESENLAVSFRESGRYVVFSAASLDGATVISRHVFEVGGGAVVNPTNPSAINIKAWSPGDKSYAKLLAGSFRSTAAFIQSRIDDGKLLTPEQIMQETAKSNKAVLGTRVGDWTAFFAKLNDYVSELSSRGSLRTMQDHVRVWNEIADSLDGYSST